MLAGLIEPLMPPEIILLNSNYDLINYNFQVVQAFKMQFYAKMFRFEMASMQKNRATGTAGRRHNQDESAIENEFNRILQGAYLELASDLIKKGLAPCVVSSLKFQEKIHDNNFFDIFFTCSIMSTSLEPQKQLLEAKLAEAKAAEPR